MFKTNKNILVSCLKVLDKSKNVCPLGSNVKKSF